MVTEPTEQIALEHERNQSRNLSIPYEKTSMASECRALDDLVDSIFNRCELEQLIAARQPTKILTAQLRLKRNLRSLLWHFVQASRVHRDCYIRIGLTEKKFSKSAAENPHGITPEIAKIIDRLEANFFIEKRGGFYGGKAKNSFLTCIRPTLSFLSELENIPRDLSEAYVCPDPVRIKGNVSDAAITSCAAIGNAEEIVSSLNEVMRSHTVTLDGWSGDHLAFQDSNDDLRVVNLTPKSLCAIFHHEPDDTFSYGRIHGGMWQKIPRDYRGKILIDGKQTVELDYSAQVLNIIASLEGIQLIGDPYAIDLGVSEWSADMNRDVVKKTALMVVNAKDAKGVIAALRGVFNKDERRKVSGVRLTNSLISTFIDAVLQAHPFLKPYAFAGHGKQLFMKDAEVALAIMKTFVDAEKVVLPIHDGFIVKVDDRNFLKQAMHSVWNEKFGTTIVVKEEMHSAVEYLTAA